MATPNFCVINANTYHVIENVEFDEWDDVIENIRTRGVREGYWASTHWNKKMDAREICYTSSCERFGTAWTTETDITSTIVIRSGYYEGAVLDYEIELVTSDADSFFLSDYDSIDDLIDAYLDALEEIIQWKGRQDKWNVGTFYIQKNNIRKWIDKRISDEIDKCESFCAENVDTELVCCGVLSNGEAVYERVG